MDELDETVAWIRAHGPAPLPLDGWDRASIWGWDETTSSLYARLWRNTDDPAKPPAIRIESDDYTPTIPFPATLAQYVAMAVDCDPWDVLTVLYEVADQDQDWRDEGRNAGATEGSTVVTMSEGYSVPEWPYRP